MALTIRDRAPRAVAGALILGALSLQGCFQKELLGGGGNGGHAGSTGGDGGATMGGAAGSEGGAEMGGAAQGGAQMGGAGGAAQGGAQMGGSGGAEMGGASQGGAAQGGAQMGGAGGVAMGGASMGGSGGSGGAGGAMLDGWARKFGDDFGMQTGTGIAAAPNGDVVVTGSFDGTMTMDGVTLSPGGTRSIFVARLTSSGTVVWAKGFAGASVFDDQAVTVDPQGNVILAGGFFGTTDFGGGPLSSANAGDEDMYLVKLDANGDHLWSKRYGDASPQPRGVPKVRTDAAGNVLLGASYTGTVDLGGGPLVASGPGADLLLAKLDPNGNHVWSKRFGDAELQVNDLPEQLRAFGVDGSGAVYFAGQMGGTIDFGLGPHSSPAGCFVAKLDASGNPVFGNVYGASSGAFRALGVTPQGGAVLTGVFNFDVDFGLGVLHSAQGAYVFMEVGPAGQTLWAKQTGGGFTVYDASTSPTGAVTFAGDAYAQIDLTGLGGPVVPASQDATSPALVTLGPGGVVLAAKAYDYPVTLIHPDRQLFGVAHDAQGYILTTGMFADGIDMGFGPLQGDDWGDLLIARLPASL